MKMGHNGPVNSILQYTGAVYCSILVAAHTIHYPAVHEHTPGAVYTHSTEQTPKLSLAARERRLVGSVLGGAAAGPAGAGRG